MIHVCHIPVEPDALYRIKVLRANSPNSQLGAMSPSGSWACEQLPAAGPEWNGALAKPMRAAERLLKDKLSTEHSYAWATSLQPGYGIGKHDHSQAAFAWTWNLTGGGQLILHPDIRIEVWPGSYVLFPATVAHFVTDHTEQFERVSVACNIYEKDWSPK